jgi:DNA-binding Lrp family transcriptional regulator
MSQLLREKRKLAALDRCILDRLQQDIPFIKRPWRSIARELNIDEPLILSRIDLLKKQGIIRRISATFNPRRIGFVSTLVAAKVAAKNIDRVAKRLNYYHEVTHNYKRDAEYNLWFTLIAQNRKKIARILSQIKKDKDIDKIIELPAIRLFKIDVKFKNSP